MRDRTARRGDRQSWGWRRGVWRVACRRLAGGRRLSRRDAGAGARLADPAGAKKNRVSIGGGLSGAEGDDAAHRVVRRNTDGDPIAGHHFDSEPPHPAAQLRQHFMAGIDLHPVQPAAVNGDYGALNINEVVFAQTRPFKQLSSVANTA